MARMTVKLDQLVFGPNRERSSGTRSIRLGTVVMLGAAFASTAIFAAPAGGQTGFPIATGSIQGQQSFGRPAFDGTNYLVGIQGDVLDRHNATAQLVSPSGTLVGPLISTDHTGGAPGVGFDGTNYLLAWTDDATDPQNQVYGELVSPSGSPVGAPFRIGPESGGQEFSGGGFDGTNYLVIWQCSNDNGPCPGIYGQLVSPAGSLIGSVITISATGRRDPRVAFDGSNYLVVWFGAGVNGGAVVGRFVSPAGVPSASEIIINASPAPSDSAGAVVFDGTNYLVAWNDEIGGTGTHQWNIFGQQLTPAGDLSGSVIPIATGPRAQVRPYAAFDGSNYLVTWTDLHNDTNNDFVCDAGEGTCADVYGIYLSTSGTPVGSAFPIIATAGNQAFSPVAFAGGKYFVVWNSDVTRSPNGELIGGDVYGRFIAPPSLACAGDCGVDNVVTIDELITMVNVAVSSDNVSACLAGDPSLDNMISAGEIFTALSNALAGC